ncbi:MAG: hypothetical protein EOP48_06775 [Sphingobacteriales bacterium]|nr:MAG: hypothetical protein EOP48_06775 [Sphingobacteriales bacterium]
MHLNKQRKKVRVAITGPSSAPKLYNALQIAYGLCGSWEKIIVLGSSHRDTIFQHLGAYNVLTIQKDSTPQRYSDLLNLCSGCNKDVIIYSNLSDEWREGVTTYLNTAYYDEVLRAHRFLFEMICHSPVHVVACIDTKKKLLYGDSAGTSRIKFDQVPVQQEKYERNFTAVLSLDKKGFSRTEKDITKILPATPFKASAQTGALFQDWCFDGNPLVPVEMQERINRCHSLAELYQLLFDLEIDDSEIISAFTRRRLELESMSEEKIREFEDEAELRAIQGGLHG